MNSLKSILKESIPTLVLAAIISLVAGLILHANKDFLHILPGILIIIPSFNQMNGAIMSVLSCRISSALHLGLIHPKLHTTKTLNRNVSATYITAILSFIAFGIIAWFFNMAVGASTATLLAFTTIIFLAGFSTTVILSFLSIIISYISYDKDIDPDNLVIPILTSVGDFIGIFLLFIIAGVII